MRERPADASADRVVDALESYSRAELSPDAAFVERTRGRVLAAYRALRLEPVRPPAPAWRRWRDLLAGHRPRPVAALAVGLSLVIATSGLVVAASGPGQPFYRVRLAIEGLTVPSQPAEAHLVAELARLRARLAEAEAAGDRGDPHAVSDAVSAYEETLSETLAGDGRDEGRAARFLSALETHVSVLEGLETKVPDQARGAIRHALDQADKARDALEGAPGHGGEGPGSEGGNPGNGGNPGHTPGGGPPGAGSP